VKRFKNSEEKAPNANKTANRKVQCLWDRTHDGPWCHRAVTVSRMKDTLLLLLLLSCLLDEPQRTHNDTAIRHAELLPSAINLSGTIAVVRDC